MEASFPGECEHRIGQLDFAAGALFALLENAENIGLEDVAAGDIEIRGRGPLRRFLDHAGDLECVAVIFADGNDTVFVRLFGRDLLDGDDVAAMLLVSRDTLGEATRLALA